MRNLKPRGALPGAHRDAGYGIQAREGCEFAFTVSGRGRFPDDMLRYDGAQLLSPVEAEQPEIPRAPARAVRIVHAHRCTPARWSSFGWSVHDDIVERAIESHKGSKGFWVTFSNEGGVLDRAFTRDEATASDAAREMLDGIPFNEGDSITVRAGWSDED